MLPRALADTAETGLPSHSQGAGCTACCGFLMCRRWGGSLCFITCSCAEVVAFAAELAHGQRRFG